MSCNSAKWATGTMAVFTLFMGLVYGLVTFIDHERFGPEAPAVTEPEAGPPKTLDELYGHYFPKGAKVVADLTREDSPFGSVWFVYELDYKDERLTVLYHWETNNIGTNRQTYGESQIVLSRTKLELEKEKP